MRWAFWVLDLGALALLFSAAVINYRARRLLREIRKIHGDAKAIHDEHIVR